MTTLAGWTRAEHAQRLREEVFDVLVIGGGVTGAGAALDLGARGLSVAVVERTDFAQGTSSRSTKLIHGGIRYLPQFHLGLISEALREQRILAAIADFLYHPLEFVIPLYAQHGLADAPAWASKGWKAPLALRAGLITYDLLGGRGRPASRHRAVSAEELLATLPTLRHTGLQRGFVYSDAQTDDVRLVVSLLKTAVMRYGATAVNQTQADLVEPDGRGFRVHLHDRHSGERSVARGRSILSATGAFDPPATSTGAPNLRVVRSKGVHLLVEPHILSLGDRALVLPETEDGRLLYIVPWLDHSMIGTTDTPYSADPTHPRADGEDTAYLLRHVRQYLDVAEFEPMTAFAGLRALEGTSARTTARTSREHVVEEPIPGYIQVAGGKLSTYRRIAAEAADAVARALGVRVASSTAGIPLVGAGVPRHTLEQRLREAGADPAVIDPTIDRNGGDVERVARLMEADRSLAAALGDRRSSLADVAHAVRHEGAARLSDFTLRRSHLAWFTPDHARKDIGRIADVMAVELGWTVAERESAIRDHEQELVAEGL